MFYEVGIETTVIDLMAISASTVCHEEQIPAKPHPKHRLSAIRTSRRGRSWYRVEIALRRTGFLVWLHRVLG